MAVEIIHKGKNTAEIEILYQFSKDEKYSEPKDDVENAKRINAKVIANEGLYNRNLRG